MASAERINPSYLGRGGWRETPQDHRIDLRDARDVRELSNAELEQIILDANPDLRRRTALPKPGS